MKMVIFHSYGTVNHDIPQTWISRSQQLARLHSLRAGMGPSAAKTGRSRLVLLKGALRLMEYPHIYI